MESSGHVGPLSFPITRYKSKLCNEMLYCLMKSMYVIDICDDTFSDKLVVISVKYLLLVICHCQYLTLIYSSIEAVLLKNFHWVPLTLRSVMLLRLIFLVNFVKIKWAATEYTTNHLRIFDLITSQRRELNMRGCYYHNTGSNLVIITCTCVSEC